MEIFGYRTFETKLKNDIKTDIKLNRNKIINHIVLYIVMKNINPVIETVDKDKNIHFLTTLDDCTTITIIVPDLGDISDDFHNKIQKKLNITEKSEFTILNDGKKIENKIELGEFIFDEFMKVSFLNKRQEFQLYDIFKQAEMLKTDFKLN
jgi:hypothetical protein